MVIIGLEFERTVNQSFNDGLIGDQFRIVFRDSNRGTPRSRRPIKQGHVLHCGLAHYSLGVLAEFTLKPG